MTLSRSQRRAKLLRRLWKLADPENSNDVKKPDLKMPEIKAPEVKERTEGKKDEREAGDTPALPGPWLPKFVFHACPAETRIQRDSALGARAKLKQTTEAEDTQPTEAEENQHAEAEDHQRAEAEETQPTETEVKRHAEAEETQPAEAEENQHVEAEENQHTEAEETQPTTAEETQPTDTEELRPFGLPELLQEPRADQPELVPERVHGGPKFAQSLTVECLLKDLNRSLHVAGGPCPAELWPEALLSTQQEKGVDLDVPVKGEDVARAKKVHPWEPPLPLPGVREHQARSTGSHESSYGGDQSRERQQHNALRAAALRAAALPANV
mmetsp:Transcript_69755/g.197669  ORF Transcript_69755/g.197669 Transcript_69755/m.197669 type:complete len:327 (-) Transcript_69755:131-1111(-)